MDAQVMRAAGLGCAGAVLTTTAALGLTRAAWAGWPGSTLVTPAEGIAFLATAGAAALAWWVTLVVVGAVRSLLGETSSQPESSRPASSRPGPSRLGRTGAPAEARDGSPLTRRVAGWLLAAVAVTAATGQAAMAAQPVTAVALAEVGPTFHPASPDPSSAAMDDAADPRGQESVPQPGWTPPEPPSRPDRRPTGDISLVSTTPAPASGVATGESQLVVVRPGDTLWDLAARHLGPEATDADVAEAWPTWYAANRAVIGDDPDLILPGQQLRIPGTTS